MAVPFNSQKVRTEKFPSPCGVMEFELDISKNGYVDAYRFRPLAG